jgi:hypothetical protein
MFASAAVSNYSNISGLREIDSIEDMNDIAGGPELLRVGTSLARQGWAGSDIATHLSAKYIILNKNQGFIPMPDFTNVPIKYQRDATELVAMARQRDVPLNEVANEYAEQLRTHFQVIWNTGVR